MTVFPLVISWFLTFGYVPEMTDSVNGRSTEIDNNRIATVAQIGLSASTDDELFTVYTDMQNFQLVIACLLAARSACPETQKRQPPKPPEYIATILRNAEIQHNLPIGLAVCISWHESSYKPTALSRCVGGYRSRGLMQIYHKYQDEIVRKYTDIPVNLFDWQNPRHSAQAGCGYLAYLIDRFDGDLYMAVLAYNWGEGNVSGLIAGRLDWDDIQAHCAIYAKNVLWMLDNLTQIPDQNVEVEQEQLWD